MSNEAQTYAARVKVGDITAKFVLSRLADRADERFSCFPSVPLLAAEAEKSERVVQRALALLRTLRLVSDRETKRADGSQGANRYYLHGPWDNYAGTGVPFPEIVTPKEKRSALWASRPVEGQFRDGTAAAVAVADDQEAAAVLAAAAAAAVEEANTAAETRREKARNARKAQATDISAGQHGVTCTSPHPVTCTSPHPVTPTSPLEPSGETPTTNHSPVPPSVSDPSARANAGSDGQTDGGEVDQQNRQQSGEPGAGSEAATAPAAPVASGAVASPVTPLPPVASEGVALLIEAARRYERATLPGELLHQLGLHVEGLLAGGWSWSQLMPQITAPLPPKEEVKKTDPTLIAARIRKLPMSPGHEGAPVPAPRPAAPAPAPARFHGCPGLDGQCEAPVSVPGQLCRACRTPCAAGCGEPARPGRGDGLCAPCGGQRDEQALPSCTACGERPATRRSGLCNPCHRAHEDQEQAQQGGHAPGDIDPQEAFAALLGTVDEYAPAYAAQQDVQAPF